MKKTEESKILLNVLCLEDVLKDAELLNEMLADAGYKVIMDIAKGEKEYLSFLKSRHYDIILSDYTLPGFEAPTALKFALKLQPEVPFICVSGTIGEDKAVELLKQGATDYVLKDRLGRLGFAVRRALEMVEQQKERNHVEKAMKEYAEQYRTMKSTGLFGFWLVDDKGKILEVNDAYCTMSGYIREEVLNLSIPDLEVIDKPEDVAARKQRVIKSGTDHFESRHKAKDGHVFDVEISMGFLHYQKQFIVFIRDITDRKQAEEKIRKIGQHYQALIEKASDGIVLLDSEAKFKFVSNPAKKIFGYNISDEITQNPAELTHPDDLNMVLLNLVRLIEDPSYVPTLQYRFAAKNGNWIWVETTFSNFLADPNVESIVLNFRNITEHKRAEEELIIAKEHAEESDRLKSAFLANMSHEIRTPLNGILGFAELLKTPELSGEQQQEYIRIIKKSGDRMLNIINDIVDISKIEAGLMEVNINESNINEQIEYIYTFFKPEVEGKRMQLFFKNTLLAKEAILKTDREKVSAIFINLVKNAIKFSDKGSIGLGYEKKGKYVEFFVTDTGIGIPKDRQEAIFNRFVQADIGDIRAFQGAGLGLSISKAYVEMLGGKIWVESDEGIGSTFYFTIPYAIELQQKTVINDIVPTEVAENQIKNLKILIVEDDKISELLISLAVKKYSKEILTVTTGIDAVETCRNTSDIDLIFMDIKMFGMDGYEATRQIRQFNKDVVIIAQTAYGLNGDREKAIAAGCDDYISKPSNIALLKRVVQKHFQNKVN